jgi:hypothetical protein
MGESVDAWEEKDVGWEHFQAEREREKDSGGFQPDLKR